LQLGLCVAQCPAARRSAVAASLRQGAAGRTCQWQCLASRPAPLKQLALPASSFSQAPRSFGPAPRSQRASPSYPCWRIHVRGVSGRGGHGRAAPAGPRLGCTPARHLPCLGLAAARCCRSPQSQARVGLLPCTAWDALEPFDNLFTHQPTPTTFSLPPCSPRTARPPPPKPRHF
jgi:hypothetical protein